MPESPETPGTRSVAQPAPHLRRIGIAIDLALVVALFAVAVWVRSGATLGDLWMDEADYALASVRGFDANRWDLSDRPSDPERLLKFRHYHPPFTAQLLIAARRFGSSERDLRRPATLAGGLTVALVYLCGLSLFRSNRRPRWLPEASAARIAALTAAAVLIWSPAHVRATSHALPWAWIALWLVALTGAMLRYADTRKPLWLTAAFAVLGMLFVTSEYFYPACLACAAALPAVFWTDFRNRERVRPVLLGIGLGVAAIAVIAWVFWPAGIAGGSAKMLRHYMAMASDPWPTTVAGVQYERAPKWAYAWWFWSLYRIFTIFYAAGLGAMALLVALKRTHRGVAILLAVLGAVLYTAHRSHIIGPEYLAHAVPFLSLVGGYCILLAADLLRPAGLMGASALCWFVVSRYSGNLMTNLDAAALRPRWPAAARFLAPRWTQRDVIMAPQFGGVARWNLMYASGIPMKEWQVQGLPPANANRKVLEDLARGVYAYVAVGSTFSPRPAIDARVAAMIRAWPIVWRSEEPAGEPSRLIIYRRPPLVSAGHPLAIPGEPAGGKTKQDELAEP